MALSRVQSTAKVSNGGTTITIPAFATLPTVGNGIVVPVSLYSNTNPTSCQDNQGNTYLFAGRAGSGTNGQAAVYYCPKIVASAAPFTITLTLPGTDWFLAGAIEVSGVGTGLVVDQTVGTTGSSATPATGATAALTAAEVFAVAVLQTRTSHSVITVEAVSPAWTEAYEELSSSNTAGEADSRVLTGAAGAPTSCSWAFGFSGVWAAVVVAFKAGVATTGLTRVQATAKATNGPALSISFSFATPPSIGNGLVVFVNQYRLAGSGGAVPATCTDNQGNTYVRAAVAETVGNVAATAIFCCAKVTATGAPFTLTVVNAPVSSGSYWVAQAVEYSNVGTGLVVDQTAGSNGVGTLTPTTGATAALTGAEVVLAAILAEAGVQSAITVETVSPVWTQEFEELPYNYIAGEADTRIVSAAAGTTASCSWTVTGTVPWAAVVVAVKAGAAAGTPARLSQLPVEVLRVSPPPVLRLSQLPIEILRSPSTSELPTAARLSQLPVEILRQLPPPARLSQLPIEVLHQVPAVPVQVTQLLVETFVRVPPAPVASSQVAAELLTRTPVHEARVTLVCCEILIIPRTIIPSCPAVSFPIDPADPPRRRRRRSP